MRWLLSSVRPLLIAALLVATSAPAATASETSGAPAISLGSGGSANADATPLSSSGAASPGASPIADARHFPQTGFRIDRDPFWDFFQKRGAVRTFGYPASHAFAFQGCTVQFFQRLVLQQCGGENAGVSTLNLLDAGLLPYTRVNGSVFPAADPALSNAAPSPTDPAYGSLVSTFVAQHAPDTFESEPVRFHETFLNTVRLEDAFPGGEGNPALLPLLNLELWGLPTSPPRRDPHNHNFIYQRFQRGIMHYDRACGCTQGLLLADHLKALMIDRGVPSDLLEQARGSGLFRAAATPGTPMAIAFGVVGPPAPLATSAAPQVAATVPESSVAAPAFRALSAEEQARFVEDMGERARRLRQETGLPPSLVVAMAINETGWGQSELARRGNNYFGIKAHRGPGDAGTVEVETWEVVDGQRITIRAAFRAYTSVDASVRDLGQFLRSSSRYAAVWTAGPDPVAVARAMLGAGYATDPAWVDKLAGLITRHNLTRFDIP